MAMPDRFPTGEQMAARCVAAGVATPVAALFFLAEALLGGSAAAADRTEASIMPAFAFSQHGKARTNGSTAPRIAAARRDGCPADLVERAQRGSRRAFAALWEKYGPTVHAILLTMVASDEADDLAQEVAIVAMRSIGSLRRSEAFPAWLASIARNLGRDALGARRRSRMVPLAEVGDVAAPAAGAPVEADEILAQIRTLPECHREVLMLRLLLEMSGPEIAAQTGMTEGSVRVNLCRGMKLLRKRLRSWEE
jgi:RNA polymerase sigma-70 factor (ECF subfamily)